MDNSIPNQSHTNRKRPAQIGACEVQPPCLRSEKLLKAADGNQEQANTNVKLPYDVLLHIFQLIDRKSFISCAQVCKDWKAAAYNPQFWKGYTLQLRKHSFLYTRVSSARSFRERGIKVVYITNMKTHRKITAKMLKNCADHARFSVMALQDIYLLPEVTMDLPRQFDCLRVLAISHSRISEEGLRIALQPMVNLEELFLHWWTAEFLSEEWFAEPPCQEFDYMEVIISNLPKLKDLEIMGSDLCISAPKIPANRPMPDLQRLVLHGMHKMDKAMGDIPIAFPNLRHFELRYARGHRNHYLKHSLFSSLCTELQSLVLSDAVFAPADVTAILHCSNLQALDLTCMIHFQNSLTDFELRSLCVSLPNLKLLNISGHESLTHKGLNRIPRCLKKLEVLKLPDVFEHHLEHLEEFLKHVGSHLKNLICLRGLDHIKLFIVEMRHIKYISMQYEEKEIRMRSSIDHTQFHEIDYGSKEWDEAVGAKFFLLPTTYHFGRIYD